MVIKVWSMNKRGEFLVFNLWWCCISKSVANSSMKNYEVFELSKEKTVPKDEKWFKEKCSKQFCHILIYEIWVVILGTVVMYVVYVVMWWNGK
jgi:hypothetical protein